MQATVEPIGKYRQCGFGKVSFGVWRLESFEFGALKEVHRFLFSRRLIFGREVLCQFATNISRERSTQIRIFKQPCFQQKRNFMKLKTFSVARTKNNQAKLITDSESSTKINEKSGQALFLTLLTSAVTYKQRFSNIFKTTKAIILFTESPYKVLLDSSKRTALKAVSATLWLVCFFTSKREHWRNKEK